MKAGGHLGELKMLDGNHDILYFPDLAWVIRRECAIHDKVTVNALDLQAALLESPQVFSTGEKRHLVPGGGQEASGVPAHTAGASDGDPQGLHLPRTPNRTAVKHEGVAVDVGGCRRGRPGDRLAEFLYPPHPSEGHLVCQPALLLPALPLCPVPSIPP